MVKISIKRYLDEENLKRLTEEKGFLLKNIISSGGELILCLRDNYFNIYYYGNSLAKVSFHSNNKYAVDINEKFVSQELLKDPNLKDSYKIVTCKNKEVVYRFTIEHYKLKNLLQKDYILAIEKNIIKEKLYFQHGIMQENLIKDNIFFIDLNITDDSADCKRIDLIGLRNIQGNIYRLVIDEVKLGNYKDLKEDDFIQTKNYSSHVRENFRDYKYTYEKQYHQLKQLGLLPGNKNESIVIDDVIEEKIISDNQQIKEVIG
ncbi:MAG: hypothetical protein LIR50_21145 [Bacillota bacterium]|nr:hypothetical protein [Bacillota bacterium]